MWSISASNSEGIGFMTVLIFIALVAVLAYGLRIYSHRQNRASLDASDYTCLCGLVSDEKSWILLEDLPRVLEVLTIGLVVILWGSSLTNLFLAFFSNPILIPRKPFPTAGAKICRNSIWRMLALLRWYAISIV